MIVIDYNSLIRFDIIPKNNRYKAKSHADACDAIENKMQQLDAIFEVLQYWCNKLNSGEDLSNADKFCLGFKSVDAVIQDTLFELSKVIITLNKIRKFLIEPYTPKLALGFISCPILLPYNYN